MERKHNGNGNGFLPLHQIDENLRGYLSQYHPDAISVYRTAQKEASKLPAGVRPAFAIWSLLELANEAIDAPRKRLVYNQPFAAEFQETHSETMRILKKQLAQTESDTELESLLRAIEETQGYINRSDRDLHRIIDAHPESHMSSETRDVVPYEDDSGQIMTSQYATISSLCEELFNYAESVTSLQDHPRKVRQLYSDVVRPKRDNSKVIAEQIQQQREILIDLKDDVLPKQIAFLDTCIDDWKNDAYASPTLTDAIQIATQAKGLYQKAAAMADRYMQQLEKQGVDTGHSKG